jgi:hypothetical protein
LGGVGVHVREKPRRTVGSDLYNGTTIDQIIAKKSAKTI